MDVGTNALSSAIGERVKQERKLRGWTLDQLAAASEVSRRMLVNLEQGTTNPSIGTLLRISGALGIGLPALVEPPSAASVRVTRHGEGATLWSSESGGAGVLVSNTEPPDLVELWDWVMMPGDRHTSEPHSPRTRELLQVQDGTIAIDVGARTVTLNTGDAVTFPGDVPHSYCNAGTAPVRFTLTVFEPSVGSRTRPEASNA